MTTWTVCPDCGIGKGADHLKGCPRRKRPSVPNYSKPMSLSMRLSRLAVVMPLHDPAAVFVQPTQLMQLREEAETNARLAMGDSIR